MPAVKISTHIYGEVRLSVIGVVSLEGDAGGKVADISMSDLHVAEVASEDTHIPWGGKCRYC